MNNKRSSELPRWYPDKWPQYTYLTRLILSPGGMDHRLAGPLCGSKLISFGLIYLPRETCLLLKSQHEIGFFDSSEIFIDGLWTVFFFSTWKKKSVRETYFWPFFHFFHAWKPLFTYTFFRNFTHGLVFSRRLFFKFHVLAGSFHAHKNEFFHAKVFIFTYRISD